MGFLKMGYDLTNFAEVQGKLATAREENRELDAALTAANLRVGELEAESANRMEKWEWWQAEAARRSRTGVVGELNRSIGDLQDQLNRSVEREDQSLASVAELEHSLSDAMEHIEAIQGANAVHMARVKELESPNCERIAAVQHEIWVHWMKYLFSCSIETAEGRATIPADKVQRWKRQMETPYSELTVKERASDLEQADKVIAVLLDQRGDGASVGWRPAAREVDFSDYVRDSQEQVIFSLPPRRCKLVVNWRSDCVTSGQVAWRLSDPSRRACSVDIISSPNTKLHGISTFEHVCVAAAGPSVELTRMGDSTSDTMIGDAVVVGFKVMELERS